MNICLVTNEFPALTETFITSKAIELSRRGHKVTVVKNQAHRELNRSHLQAIRESGIVVLDASGLNTKAAFLKGLLRHPKLLVSSLGRSRHNFVRKVRSKLKERFLANKAYDIVHFEFSGLALSYAPLLTRIAAKKVVSCRGTAEKVKPISDPTRAEQLKSLFEEVDVIHCVSEDMARTIAPFTNNSSHVFVNRPSVDPDIFKRQTPYQRRTGRLRILSIGRFTFQKGFLLGLLALAEVKKKEVDFEWVIVGDGPLKEELQFHIAALQLKEQVKLVGKKTRDEIKTLYEEVDLFLLSSVYEGIANVCLEAMSMELPVVSTKCGGMEEVITHGETGLLADNYNPLSIADQILALSRNAELRKSLGIRARRRIIEELNVQKQVERFENQYYALLELQ